MKWCNLYFAFATTYYVCAVRLVNSFWNVIQSAMSTVRCCQFAFAIAWKSWREMRTCIFATNWAIQPDVCVFVVWNWMIYHISDKLKFIESSRGPRQPRCIRWQRRHKLTIFFFLAVQLRILLSPICRPPIKVSLRLFIFALFLFFLSFFICVRNNSIRWNVSIWSWFECKN